MVSMKQYTLLAILCQSSNPFLLYSRHAVSAFRLLTPYRVDCRNHPHEWSSTQFMEAGRHICSRFVLSSIDLHSHRGNCESFHIGRRCWSNCLRRCMERQQPLVESVCLGGLLLMDCTHPQARQLYRSRDCCGARVSFCLPIGGGLGRRCSFGMLEERCFWILAGYSPASRRFWFTAVYFPASEKEGRRLNFLSSATKSYRRIFVKAGKRILAYGIRHTC